MSRFDIRTLYSADNRLYNEVSLSVFKYLSNISEGREERLEEGEKEKGRERE